MTGEAQSMPPGWVRKKLGDVLKLRNGYAFKRTEWTKTGRPIIRIQNLKSKTGPYNYYKGDLPDTFRANTGDLLFAWSGTPGTSFGAHVWEGPEAWINQHIFRVDFSNQDFDRDFLKLAFNHNLDDYIAEAQGGVGLAHITKAKLNESLLIAPPVTVQRSIARLIADYQSKRTAAADHLMQARRAIERFRQAVLAAACSGRLTAEWRDEHSDDGILDLLQVAENERRTSYGRRYSNPPILDGDELHDLPDGWKWTSFASLIVSGPQNGLYMPQSRYGSGTPILRIDDYQLDWSRSSDELKRVDVSPADRERYSLSENNIVINRVNSPSHLGKALLVRDRNLPALFESNMMRFSLASSVEPNYVAVFLQSMYGRQLLTKNAKWAVNQASINQGDVNNTPIPVPPFSEQREIVRRVQSLLGGADRLLPMIDRAAIRVERSAQAVLAKAFRGELSTAQNGES